MPEGDTVFLTGRRLHDAMAGKVLVRAELRHPQLSTVRLNGRTVREVATVGKHLLTRFDNDRTLHSHLRMDGSWQLYRPGQRWRGGPAHAVRAVLAVSDRVAVGYRLHDLALVPTAHEPRLVGHLGPDLLDPVWDSQLAAQAAERLARQPQRELGLALLDQTVMAGVGNLYRAEICFLLGVSPWTPVAEVDPIAVVELAHKLLARNAWRPQQSTTGELLGGARQLVYGRTGRACLRCGTAIRSASLGEPSHPEQERVVYFCPNCQPPPSRGSGTSAGSASASARRRPCSNR